MNHETVWVIFLLVGITLAGVSAIIAVDEYWKQQERTLFPIPSDSVIDNRVLSVYGYSTPYDYGSDPNYTFDSYQSVGPLDITYWKLNNKSETNPNHTFSEIRKDAGSIPENATIVGATCVGCANAAQELEYRDRGTP